MPNQPGPLEQLARHPVKGYVDHCEMCGKPTRNAMLEPAFDPDGEAKILCRQCRIGSAELLHDQRAAMLEALKEFFAQDIPCPFKGNDGRLKDFAEWYKKAQAVVAKAEGRR